MKLPAKKKHSRKTSRLPLYLLLAVVVTTLATTGTLARYRSEFGATANMEVAAFAGGGTLDFNLDVDLGNMYPNETRTTTFTVQNYEGDKKCDVVMDYDIRVDTAGNLPLTFTLRGKRDNDGENSVLAGDFEAVPGEDSSAGGGPAGGKTFVASGGRLPIAGGTDGRPTQHTYQLEVTWEKTENDIQYLGEIDKVTVTVTAVQARPEAVPRGEESSGGESSGESEPEEPEPEESD